MKPLLPLLLAWSCAAISIDRQRARLRTGVDYGWLRATPDVRRPRAPPLVFVHGTYHGSWCWENYLRAAAEEGYDAVAVDLRGTSGSPSGAKKVRMAEHVDDLRAFVADALGGARAPALVGHSFGGAVVQKLLEADADARLADGRAAPSVAGAALVCSVPPSGNAGMVKRFVLRTPRRALVVTRGFALKSVLTSRADCRELFFGARSGVADGALDAHMRRMAADATCGLDLADFQRALPSRRAVAPSGRADWLERAPPCLVVGARDDFVVDLDGVRETAAFFGVEPVVLADAPHDLMLAPGWERTMAPLLDWLAGLGDFAEGAA